MQTEKLDPFWVATPDEWTDRLGALLGALGIDPRRVVAAADAFTLDPNGTLLVREYVLDVDGHKQLDPSDPSDPVPWTVQRRYFLSAKPSAGWGMGGPAAEAVEG